TDGLIWRQFRRISPRRRSNDGSTKRCRSWRMNGRTTYGGGKVTMRSVAPPGLPGGAAFARQLRNVEFRTFLSELGWTPKMDVVVAAQDERFTELLARMIINGTTSPCLIVVPYEGEKYGFKFAIAATAAPEGHDDHEAINVGPGANLGMLFAATMPCGAY